MRGALRGRRLRHAGLGIIPADAGSTGLDGALAVWVWDHPRGCGEHSMDHEQLQRRAGSSPRMRGALLPEIAAAAGLRIIPADAGSTWQPGSQRSGSQDHPRGCGEHCSSRCSGKAPRKDHPRGCGEHQRLAIQEGCDEGSSPRMRGAHPTRSQVLRRGRIIPADAGSTILARSSLKQPEDHPRGCGEHMKDRGM